MTLDKISEEEILDLLTKTEKEQMVWLIDNGIAGKSDHFDIRVIESLPELAERLWEKAIEKAISYLLDVIIEFKMTLVIKSDSIHRIVAASLVLKRAGAKI